MMKYDLVFEAVVEDKCCVTTQGFSTLTRQLDCEVFQSKASTYTTEDKGCTY